MDHFKRRDGALFCENVHLAHIAANTGTPVYIYSKATLDHHCQTFMRAFSGYPTLACYAVKANSNLSILRNIFRHGFGADLVSRGELERARLAGCPPEHMVFSGVGKTKEEIEQALGLGILTFNTESPFELEMIAAAAQRAGVEARISIRLNPNIDAKTHEKIATGLYSTKFGIPESELAEVLGQVRRHAGKIALTGVACHIGSQILDLSPIREAARRMSEIARHLTGNGFPLAHINMGGGLGIRYADEETPALRDYADALISSVSRTGLKLIVEPGRVIAGNAGVLVTAVIGIKSTPERHFVVTDAAMTELIRPTLYGSHHEIEHLLLPDPQQPVGVCDFVGPVCETGDFIGKNRKTIIPRPGDLLVVRSCGAYGATMASNYNSRPRSPEVLVQNSTWNVVARRETLDALLCREKEFLG